MTHLRKMMLEDFQRRNYSQDTIRSYIRAVEDFSRRFNRPPDRLGPRHIREYQTELFQKRKLSPGTITTRLAALRFFYIKTLKKSWNIAETAYPKKRRRIPTVLSPQEVAQLIDAARTPYSTKQSDTAALTGLAPYLCCSFHRTVGRIRLAVRKDVADAHNLHGKRTRKEVPEVF